MSENVASFPNAESNEDQVEQSNQSSGEASDVGGVAVERFR